jgi:hypothetical protein
VQEYYDNPIAELPEIKRSSNATESSVIVGETIVPQDTIIGYYIPKEYLKKTAK